MQLNENRDITIPKQLPGDEDAYITTLQVNQWSYLNNANIPGCLTFINININTLYQTRAWVSLQVIYNPLSQVPVLDY